MSIIVAPARFYVGIRPSHLLRNLPIKHTTFTLRYSISTTSPRAFPSTAPKMQAVADKLAQNFTGTHGLASSKFSIEEVPDLSGKVAVVTGGSEGIGYGVTHTLLKKNIEKLFVTSLRVEKGEDALDAVEKELGPEARKKIVYIQLDQSDWAAAAKVASDIASQTDRIDMLFNNAARGIASVQKAHSNGIDLHMAINHFGHEVITSHLLPTLKATADKGHTVRIVNASSSLHESAPSETKFESVEELNKDYGGNAQYGRAKLANLLHAKYLHRHLHSTNPKILINATHPGIVDTAQTSEHIHDAYPLLGYGMSVAMKPFQKSQFEGAVSALYALTTIETSGNYVCPPAIIEKGSDKANDAALGEQLMKLTREVIEEKTKAIEQGCPFKDA